MTTNRTSTPRPRVIHLIAAGLLSVGTFGIAGTASASEGDAPTPEGPPSEWGPTRKALCEDAALGAALGYNVIVGTNLADGIVGTIGDDLILALDGDDTVDGLQGNDVICLGKGDDRARGGPGWDAIFGEEDRDRIRGNTGRDYLDGGDANDRCDGGPQTDAGVNCESVISIP